MTREERSHAECQAVLKMSYPVVSCHSGTSLQTTARVARGASGGPMPRSVSQPSRPSDSSFPFTRQTWAENYFLYSPLRPCACAGLDAFMPGSSKGPSRSSSTYAALSFARGTANISRPASFKETRLRLLSPATCNSCVRGPSLTTWHHLHVCCVLDMLCWP